MSCGPAIMRGGAQAVLCICTTSPTSPTVMSNSSGILHTAIAMDHDQIPKVKKVRSRIIFAS